MFYAQAEWSRSKGFSYLTQEKSKDKMQLVIYISERPLVENNDFLQILRTEYPNAFLIGCCSDETGDDHQGKIQIHALGFDSIDLRLIQVRVIPDQDPYHTGQRISAFLKNDNLAGVMVLADFTGNIKAFLAGLSEKFPCKLPVISQMRDSSASHRLFGCNFLPQERQIVAIGFYGSQFPLTQEGRMLESLFASI
jgi:hypothetical protein